MVDWLTVWQTIDPLVLDVWEAFDCIDPIGEARADYRAATMTAHLLARHTPTGVTPRGPDEYLCWKEPTAVELFGVSDSDGERLRAVREQNSFR